MGQIIPSILQMKKLRHGEIKQFAEDHRMKEVI